MAPSIRRSRRGLSLLELVIATSLLAMIMATLSVVLRTSRQAWEAHEADYTQIEAAHATLRHIVREIRQADGVILVSVSTDNSGRLVLQMGDGSIKAWDHDNATRNVTHGVNEPGNAASNLLAPGITALRFDARRADLTTQTTVPSQVQCLWVEVTVTLPRGANATHQVGSWAWVRSW